MRILEVVHGFPPDAYGGSEVYAAAHAAALHREFGDEVLVITREADPARPEYAVREERREGVRVVRLNNTFRLTRSLEESYRHPAISRIVERFIDDFRPDVAHVHHLTCLSTEIVPALGARQIPIFFTLHDYWLMCHRGQLYDLHRRVCDGPGEEGCHACLGAVAGAPTGAGHVARWVRAVERTLPAPSASWLRVTSQKAATLLASADQEHEAERQRLIHMRGICAAVTQFIAPCAFMKRQFVRFGVPDERISVSRYGFDRAPFDRTLAPASHVRHQPLRLGFLGSLMVSKAPHLLIEACRDLPRGSVSVSVYGVPVAYHGDASYEAQLRPLLEEPFVEWSGAVAHDAVPVTLRELDALVVPSVWPENSPLVIQEAFLAGVPVVASRIGGIPELVSDGVNGLLFEPGSASDLGRVLRRLLDEGGLIDTLRRGVPSVRSIEDDVRETRAEYERHAVRRGVRVNAARPSPTDTPDRATTGVAAVVVNYRTPDETLLAVRSLLASRRPLQDIIVVDNDANDDCRSTLAPVSSAFTYLPTGRNLGFSGGVNVGIREALARGADAVLLVNSDVIVPPDCVGELLRTIDADPTVGIAGPVLRSRTNPDRIESAGITYNEATGRMRHLQGASLDEISESERQRDIRAVSGCVMLIGRAVFDGIGFFDEDYFYSFEDIDFCWRARAAGFATRLSSDAAAYHQGSRSAAVSNVRTLYFAARNHLLMNSRLQTRTTGLRKQLRPGIIVSLNVAHALFSSGQPARAGLRDVWAGCRDHLRSRYGNRPSEGV